MVRAKMAVWELAEPLAVMKASTRSRSSRAVSLGARSSAAMMAGSASISASSSRPVSRRITRRDTSSTSAARSFM